MPKLDLSHPEREFVRGYYVATEKFRAIGEHVAVMRKDGQLVAVVGPAASTGATEQSVREAEFFADLFAASPKMHAAITGALDMIECAAGKTLDCGECINCDVITLLKNSLPEGA